ncbi:MAG: hypothetical protein Q4P23_03430 [Micrococcaceae bacterium]|nr:hypothetical protein [Micrococcaceae bacterium]
MDLALWFRERRWVALLELIDGLPSASRLNEAISNDPDLAEAIASQPEPSEPWSPRIADYSLTNVILIQIVDSLKALQQTQIAAAGGKPGHMKPFPTPRTAIDRFREAQEQEFIAEMAGLLGFSPGDY